MFLSISQLVYKYRDLNNIYQIFEEINLTELKKNRPEISEIITILSKKGNIFFSKTEKFKINNLQFQCRKRHYKSIKKIYEMFDPNVIYFIFNLKEYKRSNIKNENTYEIIYCRCQDKNIIKKFKLTNLINGKTI